MLLSETLMDRTSEARITMMISVRDSFTFIFY
jgi:hypothetical protein